MNQTAIAIGFILFAGGIAGYFNRYKEEDWKELRRGIKAGLSGIKDWFIHGDKKVVYPVALITGLLVATAASWVMM